MVPVPWLVALALQADGWWLRSDIIWHKPNPMPESVTDRPTKSHEYVFLMTRAERYYYDQEAVAEALTPNTHPPGNRNKYDASRPDGMTLRPNRDTDYRRQTSRNLRSVWTIPAEPYPEAHFATFPTALAERCIRAGSEPGDTILDPFAGSGTTLLVARALGRNAVGIELNPEYVTIAEQRCALPWERKEKEDSTTPSLFDGV
jgi:DNA modification methylase